MSTPETSAGPTPEAVAEAQALLDQHGEAVAAAQKILERQKLLETSSRIAVNLTQIVAFTSSISSTSAQIRAAVAGLDGLPSSPNLSVIHAQAASLDAMLTQAGHIKDALERERVATEKALGEDAS